MKIAKPSEIHLLYIKKPQLMNILNLGNSVIYNTCDNFNYLCDNPDLNRATVFHLIYEFRRLSNNPDDLKFFVPVYGAIYKNKRIRSIRNELMHGQASFSLRSANYIIELKSDLDRENNLFDTHFIVSTALELIKANRPNVICLNRQAFFDLDSVVLRFQQLKDTGLSIETGESEPGTFLC